MGRRNGKNTTKSKQNIDTCFFLCEYFYCDIHVESCLNFEKFACNINGLKFLKFCNKVSLRVMAGTHSQYLVTFLLAF